MKFPYSLAAVALTLAIPIAALGLEQRSTAKPGFSNLSGTYSYSGLGKHKVYHFPNELIDFKELKAPSEIELIHHKNKLTLSYVGNDGQKRTRTIDLKAPPAGITWTSDVLRMEKAVPVQGPRILPGAAKHTRGTRIFRATDGDLRIIGHFQEKGRMLLLVPFTDYEDYELILKRKQ